MPLQFSLEDVKDAGKLARLLRQIQIELQNIQRSIPQLPSDQALAKKLAPFIRDELQARGSAPLNIVSLPPSSIPSPAPCIEEAIITTTGDFIFTTTGDLVTTACP